MRRIQDHFSMPQRLRSASDSELLAAFRQHRDEVSFHEIVLRHGRLVQSATRQVLQNASDVEDIVQATFLTLIQRPAAVRRSDSLGSWLYGVAHRLALQQRRSSARRQRREQHPVIKSLDTASRSAAVAELQSVVAEALQAIPERYRQAILYCYLEERTPEEAANLLGCPVGTLWSRLSRGREKLRAYLTRRGWNLEQPALGLLLASAAGKADAATAIWQSLKEVVQWQPEAGLVPVLKPAIAGLLLKEKLMVSVRSILHMMVLLGMLAGGARLGWCMLAQTPESMTGELPNASPVQPMGPAEVNEPLVQPSTYPADWKGKLRGTITAADTGKPLAGATVCVMLNGIAEPYNVVYATSASDGVYSVPLPIGHAWLFGLSSPPGYFSQDYHRTHISLVSKANEEVVQDFKLTPGISWKVKTGTKPSYNKKQYPVRFFADTDVPPGTVMSNGSDIQVMGDAEGNGILAVPAGTGRYRISGMWLGVGDKRIFSSGVIELEAKFDPTKVVGPIETLPDGKGQRIRDAAGRVATLTDAEFLLEGKQVTIRLVTKPASKEPDLILRGKVLDEKKQPLAGVEAVLGFYSAHGGAMSEYQATTNALGEFQVRGPARSDGQAAPTGRVSAMIRKSGYFAVESRKLDMVEILEKGFGDFGTIVLQPGLTLKGTVVDSEGHPVQGAVITNQSNYFLYSHLICRTDAAGHFAMPDLPPGKHQLGVQCGMEGANVTYDLADKNGEVRIEVRTPPGSGRRQNSTYSVPPAARSTGPTWDLTPPTKEPKYQHEPRYSLLVFGPYQETRVWLVLDGEVLYVDVQGTGDLTLPECRITPSVGSVTLGNPGFYRDIVTYPFDISKLGGTGKSTFKLEVLRRAAGFVPRSDMDRRVDKEWKEYGWERAILTRTSQYGKSASHAVYFVRRPAQSQVINYDGPLMFSMKNGNDQIFERGKGGSDFSLHIGTVARPAEKSSYARFTQLGLAEVPDEVYLIADVTFPGKTPSASLIVKRFELKQRCCGDTFYGTVVVPAEAGPGLAKVRVTSSPWPGQDVKAGKFEVSIEE